MVGFQLFNAFSETALQLLAGGTAGCAGIVIGQPFDFIKIRLQTEPLKYRNALHCLVDVVKHEGVSSLFRGMLAPLFGQFFQNALIFAGEGMALKYLEPDIRLSSKEMSNKTVMNVFVAGMFGGFLQCLVLSPTDLIKCKLQVDGQRNDGKANLYSGSIDCIRKVYQEGGIPAFYRGFAVTALREVPAFGVYFFVYRYTLSGLTKLTSSTSSNSKAVMSTRPQTQQQHHHQQQQQQQSEPPRGSNRHNDDHPVGNDEGPGLATFVAGGLAGCSSWLVIYPVDVVKSHVQTASGKNESGIGTAIRLYQLHGLRIFTRGLGVTMLRAFPVNATVFYFLEHLKIKFNIQ